MWFNSSTDKIYFERMWERVINLIYLNAFIYIYILFYGFMKWEFKFYQ